MAHDVHPKKIIETDDGKIVMERPDLLRTTALSNTITTYLLTDDELLSMNEMETSEERDRFMQLKMLKKGYTTLQYTALSYVTSAPFHLNDYRVEPILDIASFLEYADAELISKMADAMKGLGMIDPLHP